MYVKETRETSKEGGKVKQDTWQRPLGQIDKKRYKTTQSIPVSVGKNALCLFRIEKIDIFVVKIFT